MSDIEPFDLLKEGIDHLQKASDILSQSYMRCKQIGIKTEYSNEELTEFEALTRRFTRLVNLLIHKIFRTVDVINIAPETTVRDSIHRAEKNQLIDYAESLIEMKRLCNQIANECIIENLFAFFEKIITFSPLLLNYSARATTYCEKLSHNFTASQ